MLANSNIKAIIGRVLDKVLYPSLCGCHNKDYIYLLTCLSHNQKDSWTIFLGQLDTTFTFHKLNPGLQWTLHLLLQYFPFTSPPTDLSPSYQSIYDQQMQFEPRLIFSGHFIKE